MRRREYGELDMKPDKVIEYRFPRTPHLPGSSIIDDDRSMDRTELSGLCQRGEIHVQEKVDGANCSVFFESETQPVMVSSKGKQ